MEIKNYFYKNLLLIFIFFLLGFNLNSEILFTKNYYDYTNLYICNDDGNNIKQITDKKDSHIQYFDYMNETNSIVYQEYNYNKGIVFIKMKNIVNGDEEILKKENSFFLYKPYLSDITSIPNTNYVLYTKAIDFSNTETIYLFDVNIKKSKKIISLKNIHSINCSTNGEFLVFVKDNEIFKMDINGKNLVQLTNDNLIIEKKMPIFNTTDDFIYFIGREKIENKENINPDELPKYYYVYELNLNRKTIKKLTVKKAKHFYYCLELKNNTTLLFSEFLNGKRNLSEFNIETGNEKIILESDTGIERISYF